MKQLKLDPKNITQPIQLLGASLIGSVFLVGEFLYASLKSLGTVISWFYGITAILIFPIILIFIFILQTKYRDEIQSDPFYYLTKQYENQLKYMKKMDLSKIKK